MLKQPLKQRGVIPRFFTLVNSAVQQGGAQIAHIHRDRMGWTILPGTSPHVPIIGWRDGSTLYLDPAAYATTQQEAARHGDRFAPGTITLARALAAAGLIQGADRRRFTTRLVIDGQRRRLLPLPATVLDRLPPPPPWPHRAKARQRLSEP